jgi:polynucleotide 5'-hydroxyl-kinase GRC3/NOL9
VKRGVISLVGSKLHASPSLHRVYAPSTHSLPVIKYVSGAEGYAEVEIRSCRAGIDGLGGLSPLYSRVWNEAVTEADKTLAREATKRSFSVVSSPSNSLSINASTNI